MNTKIINVIHYGVSVILFIVSLSIFSGCAVRTVTEYEHVYIPTKCEVSTPIKPIATDDAVETNLLILQYAEQLEQSLKRCN